MDAFFPYALVIQQCYYNTMLSPNGTPSLTLLRRAEARRRVRAGRTLLITMFCCQASGWRPLRVPLTLLGQWHCWSLPATHNTMIHQKHTHMCTTCSSNWASTVLNYDECNWGRYTRLAVIGLRGPDGTEGSTWLVGWKWWGLTRLPVRTTRRSIDALFPRLLTLCWASRCWGEACLVIHSVWHACA